MPNQIQRLFHGGRTSTLRRSVPLAVSQHGHGYRLGYAEAQLGRQVRAGASDAYIEGFMARLDEEWQTRQKEVAESN